MTAFCMTFTLSAFPPPWPSGTSVSACLVCFTARLKLFLSLFACFCDKLGISYRCLPKLIPMWFRSFHISIFPFSFGTRSSIATFVLVSPSQTMTLIAAPAARSASAPSTAISLSMFDDAALLFQLLVHLCSRASLPSAFERMHVMQRQQR